jgi:hypothetical protein|tara:strand:+ start:942 stop:1073 length:132 start_codon:yes stop_codon:yes gene_type:complete
VEILESTLEKFDDGKIDISEKKIDPISLPYTGTEFPFIDLDEK